MIAFFYVLLASYLLFLLLIIWGWSKATSAKYDVSTEIKSISVVIPFRNEELVLNSLLSSLANLDYPPDRYNVILVNDHSEDSSRKIVAGYIENRSNYQLIHLADNYNGKKNALTAGIENSKSEIIVTTDADCTVGANWLSVINNSFANKSTKLVFGGVRLSQDSSFFTKLQAIEFSSLIGSGAATNGLGFFTMCNGANLAFLREAFADVKGYSGNFNVPSGDDEFLARKIATKYKGSIRFLNHEEAVVSTSPQTTWQQFVRQRLRWAGKWRYNDNLVSNFIALLVFLYQIAFFAIVGALLIGRIDLIAGLSLVVSKVLLESIFLICVNRFLKSAWHWPSFFVLQLCYPLYVIGIGLFAQTRSYIWKGRSLSHKM